MFTMDFDEMVSELDTAVGMLAVPAMKDSTIRKAIQVINKVSIALGEKAEQEE